MTGRDWWPIHNPAASSSNQGVDEQLNVQAVHYAVAVHVRQHGVATGVPADHRGHKVRKVDHVHRLVAVHVARLEERASDAKAYVVILV